MVYAVSDIHGCFDMWKHLLNEIKFKESDDMYVLGDVLDYGEEPMELLFDMMERINVYPILGESEYRFLSIMKDIPFNTTTGNFATALKPEKIPEFTDWIKNGGRTTFEGYMKLSPADRKAVTEYLSEFMLWDSAVAKDDRFVFLHAGIRDFVQGKELDEYRIDSFIFDGNVKPKSYFRDAYTVVGHTPTFALENGVPGRIYSEGGSIDIDCGCFFTNSGGRLGCLRLDDMKEFYV